MAVDSSESPGTEISTETPIETSAAESPRLQNSGVRLISVRDYGATGNGTTDDTVAIQRAIDEANRIEAGVFFPAAMYRVSQLVLRRGTILQGVSSGTYPDNHTISGASVLARLANTNKHLLLAPDGANYCRIYDLAIDGNRNNNTAGYGLCVADSATGHESQIIVERCYFHTNPDSNIYLGRNRRANSILNGVYNYSAKGDGITVAGSDNTIAGNICGSNARAGICLGTTATQNWPASSPSSAAAICHVTSNDIYNNLVGIAVANASSGCMISNNGIDRNKYQGITVYSGASNALVTNSLHSNGTARDNSYAHIDVGAAVTQVCISNNNFTPLDSDVTNVANFCLYVAPGATRVIGDIGAADPTTARALTNVQAGAAPWTSVSNIGAVIQGSGNDIITLRNRGGTTITKVTEGGSLVHSGGGTQFTQPFNHVFGASSPIRGDAYLVSLVSGRANTSQVATRNFEGQTAPITAWFGFDGSTMLGGVDAGGGVLVNGVPGATAGARFAGGTRSGAPTSGSWKAGDYVIDHTGKVWIYTGSAWVAAGGSGGGVTVDNTSLPLADAIVATPGNSARAAPSNHAHPRTYWNPSDTGLVTWTMDVMMASANSVLPAAGTLYLVRVHVPVAATVRNIMAAITNAGSGLRAGQCFAGLWNASSRALVGATAEQSGNWSTTGFKTMALPGTGVSLAAGDYYIGIYANGTTLPHFARGNNQIGGAFANTGATANFRVATANTGLTGSPPATLGTLTAANTSWWLGLS
jgi:parallel beta-helix repeat protein